MDITDLVTNTLAPDCEQVEDRPATTIRQSLRQRKNAGALLHEGEAILQEMQELRGNEFHFQASQLATLFISFSYQGNQYRQPYFLHEAAAAPRLVGAEIFARAADVLEKDSGYENLLAFARQALDNHYLNNFFRDPQQHLNFVEDFWGEETIDRLMKLGGVQRGTARNWLRGGSPASAQRELRRTVAVLYHLRSSAGIDEDSARQWLDRKLESGETPFEIICEDRNSSWSMHSGDFSLDPLTSALEKLGIEAFSWPAHS